MADCFRQTVKNKGVLGLWSGLTPSLLKVRFCFHPSQILSWRNQDSFGQLGIASLWHTFVLSSLYVTESVTKQIINQPWNLAWLYSPNASLASRCSKSISTSVKKGVLLTHKMWNGWEIASNPLRTAKELLLLTWGSAIWHVVVSYKKNCACISHLLQSPKQCFQPAI